MPVDVAANLHASIWHLLSATSLTGLGMQASYTYHPFFWDLDIFDCFLTLIAHLNAVNLFSFIWDHGKIGQKLHHFLYNLKRGKNTKRCQLQRILEKPFGKWKRNTKLIESKSTCYKTQLFNKHSYTYQAFITIASTYAFHGTHLASLVDRITHKGGEKEREGG